MADVRASGLFDRWARTYDRPGLQLSTYRPVHDAVLSRLRRAEPEVIVDLGCGTGQLTRRLVGRFPHADVIGLDLSPGMVAKAADRVGDRAGLVIGDAAALPVADGTVSVITCVESFHWYPEPDRVAAELVRVLEPGGRALIASIAAVTDLGAAILATASRRGGGPEVRAVPPRRLRTTLERHGLVVTSQRRIPRPGFLPWPILVEARRP